MNCLCGQPATIRLTASYTHGRTHRDRTVLVCDRCSDPTGWQMLTEADQVRGERI